MDKEQESRNKMKRNLEILNLLIWIVGIPILGFILALITLISTRYVQSSPLLPLVYLSSLIFLSFGLLWNRMHKNSEIKILLRYIEQNETQEDIKIAKNLKYVTLIYILFLIVLVQYIFEILG